MAINKNALVRYKVLDKCFRNIGRKYFMVDLIHECDLALSQIDGNHESISRRQIFDDIRFMESNEGWNINLLRLREGKKVYYRYADSNFSINNMPLNEVEVNQLQVALDILSQFTGMPQFEWVHELLPKLKSGIQTPPIPLIEFETNIYLKGIEHLAPLYNAIYYKKTLNIKYQPFNEEIPHFLKLHPYYLKQYNNRWFIFGLNPENQKSDWNLALDRIIGFTEISDKYIENDQIDWTEYFDDIIGVTKPINGKTEIIKLFFFGKTGNYIETKPIHGSQKAKWISSDILEVRLELMINYELERLILSYADSVKAIEPQSLAQRIKNRLVSGSIRYEVIKDGYL